jgi:uncharacterized protein with PIN domain
MKERKFFCDAMLGRLARWLRILGYDTAYARDLADARVVAKAGAEGRVLLTRDTRLVARAGIGLHLLVHANATDDQLREVVAAFGLSIDRARMLRRCVACNGAVEPVPRDEARGLVPPYVYGTQETFARCAACGRFYWPATHRDRILRRLEELLGEASGAAVEGEGGMPGAG